MHRNLSPIILFVYNRPWHTKQTLDALANNELASLSELFIYCDGPKNDINSIDKDQIQKTRELVLNEKRFKKVTIIKSEFNKGLANSIIDGVTNIVNKYGKVIVLEDDIVTSKGFLTYMNEALNLYYNDSKVMHISGYMYPIQKQLPESFFIKPASCWGWATWKRAWDFFEKDAEKHIRLINQIDGWDEFTIDNSFPSYKDQLFLNKDGHIDTWAIFWYSSIFLKGGLSLHPYPSLVQNIGFDGSGVHCSTSGSIIFTWAKISDFVRVKKLKKKVDRKSFNALKDYFMKINKLEKRTLRDRFYLFRKNKLNQIKDLVNLLFRYNHYRLIKNSILQKQPNVTNLERYTPGVIKLFGKKVYFVDQLSYESTYQELFLQKIYSFKANRENPVIIDCGANIGLSIIFFKQLYPKCKITAFEADPKIFDVLSKNIKSFEFKDVELINYALWDTETILQFYSEGADGGRINSIIDNSTEMIEVKTQKLSGYLQKKVDFLKIDIEGAEYKVLKDCKLLLKNVENLFVEYHSFVDSEQKLDNILTILKDNGFRYYVSSIGVKSKHPFLNRNEYLGMDNQINIFAYRK